MEKRSTLKSIYISRKRYIVRLYIIALPGSKEVPYQYVKESLWHKEKQSLEAPNRCTTLTRATGDNQFT